MSNRRTFNLGNISARIANLRADRYNSPEPDEDITAQGDPYKFGDEQKFDSIPRIPRGIENTPSEESPLGSFLIRLILCITLFSLVMLMKNSTNENVTVTYNAIKAWATCNYSIPEEYGIEKFVAALKSGDFMSVFSPVSYPCIKFPTKGEITVHYGDKDENGAECLGIIISATEKNDILPSVPGTVTDINNNSVFGNYVAVESNSGLRIIYGCCDEITVKIGDTIDTDTIIAQMSKGNDDKYYLYMEVQNNEKVIDPEKCFAKGV